MRVRTVLTLVDRVQQIRLKTMGMRPYLGRSRLGIFLVGQELRGKEIVNPRLQFRLDAIQPDIRELLIGYQVGDIIKIPNRHSFQILEMFEL